MTRITPDARDIATRRASASPPFREFSRHCFASPRPIILRPYQLDLLHALPYGPGNRTLMQLATGAGKTEIAMTWAQLRNPTPSRPLWFVVHTIELLRQTFKRFVRAGFAPGKICFGEGEDGSKSIHICTIQTLTARQRRSVNFTPPAFIILDEAHRSAAQSFRIMLKRYPKAEVLGMTAAPVSRHPPMR
jgi:superfamily II DNA or RNA helicase